MMKVERQNPIKQKKTIVDKQLTIKCFSYNSNGNFFIVYHDELDEEEKLICLKPTEFQLLKSFMEKIK